MNLYEVSTECLQQELFLRHPFTQILAEINGKTIEQLREELRTR